MRTSSLAIVVSGLLVLAACGDDDDGGGAGSLSSEEQDYVDAAMVDFDAEEAAPMTKDDAECIVTSMVDVLGTDRLEELGLTPEDFSSTDSFPEGLTEDEADDVIKGFNECVDMADLFLQEITADQDLSDDAKECLVDAFDEDVINQIFRTVLVKGQDAIQEDQELMSELLKAMAECPEAMAGLGG